MTTDNEIARPMARSVKPSFLGSLLRRLRMVARASSDRPQRTLLFGLFGCGNLGNDGSLEVMLEMLRRNHPGADVYCACDNPDLIARRFQIPAVPISRSRHYRGLARRLDRLCLRLPGKLVDVVQTLRHIRGTGTMIIPGTGILDDFGERPYGMPLDILIWCLAARLVGARISFVCIGAGPIRREYSRRLMKASARLAHYRSYRDEMSRDYMQSIGFDASRDRIFPDIVFAMRTPSEIARNGAERPLTIGVGVMSYYGWFGGPDGDHIFATYIAKLARFVAHLLEAGYDIRLLTGERSDWTAVDALVHEVSSTHPDFRSGRMVAEPAESLGELMEQIATTDIVVATRFHNIVCALKLAKPVVSIGYSRKNDVLLQEMSLGDYCQHVESFEVDQLIDQLSRVVQKRHQLSETIARRTSSYEEMLRRQEVVLRAR